MEAESPSDWPTQLLHRSALWPRNGNASWHSSFKRSHPQIQGLVLPAVIDQKSIHGEGSFRMGCNKSQKSLPFQDDAKNLESTLIVLVPGFVTKRGVGTVSTNPVNHVSFSSLYSRNVHWKPNMCETLSVWCQHPGNRTDSLPACSLHQGWDENNRQVIGD